MNLRKITYIPLVVMAVSLCVFSVNANETVPPFPDIDQWESTDFSRHSIDLHNIIEAGPGKDGFQSIDKPAFKSADEINWLDDAEPVAVVRIGRRVRAYPLQILIHHEIVNDVIGDVPFVATYCPLCNAAIFMQRKSKNRVLEFGSAGKVVDSNMIMYDRQTQSWWQQFTGECVVGELTGQKLEILPAQIVSFAQYRNAYPDGAVLLRSRDTDKTYGVNPYRKYDSRDKPWSSYFRKPVNPQLPALERVLGIYLNHHAKAYPFSVLKESSVLQDEVNGVSIVVISRLGPVSPVDEKVIRSSKRILMAAAFRRHVKGNLVLDFGWDGSQLKDKQTGTTWNVFGKAINGPLKGEHLEQVDYGVYFAFAWLNFFPQSVIYQSQ